MVKLPSKTLLEPNKAKLADAPSEALRVSYTSISRVVKKEPGRARVILFLVFALLFPFPKPLTDSFSESWLEPFSEPFLEPLEVNFPFPLFLSRM